MKILPVLDLLHGEIVRGVAGQRADYRPLRSSLVASSEPAAVAAALVATFSCSELYLADLDAIQGHPPHWETYRRVADCGVQLLLDAGLRSVDQVLRLSDFARTEKSIAGIVVGLESVPSLEFLQDSGRLLGPELGVFSLDLQHGRPLTSLADLRNSPPETLAAWAVAAGFQRLIVLDLAAVGTGDGPATLPLCRLLRQRFPQLEIISGGGVRGPADVDQFLAAGCDRVLVASALHDGRITK